MYLVNTLFCILLLIRYAVMEDIPASQETTDMNQKNESGIGKTLLELLEEFGNVIKKDKTQVVYETQPIPEVKNPEVTQPDPEISQLIMEKNQPSQTQPDPAVIQPTPEDKAPETINPQDKTGVDKDGEVKTPEVTQPIQQEKTTEILQPSEIQSDIQTTQSTPEVKTPEVTQSISEVNTPETNQVTVHLSSEPQLQTFKNTTSKNKELYSICTIEDSPKSKISCKPSSNYTYVTENQRISEKEELNSTSFDGKMSVFLSDCWGLPSKDECYWISSCITLESTPVKYNCVVYESKQLSLGPVCENFIKTSSKIPNWCANCTQCNFTGWSGAPDTNISCTPCSNFTFTTQNKQISLEKIPDYTSFFNNVDQIFRSDCSNGYCGWCTKTVRSELGSFEVLTCDGLTKNGSTNVFRYEIGEGLDWCANCSVFAGELVRCLPCTSYAEYTSLKCFRNVTIGKKAGVDWCSNCTTCNNGYLICNPCQPEALRSTNIQRGENGSFRESAGGASDEARKSHRGASAGRKFRSRFRRRHGFTRRHFGLLNAGYN